MADVGEDEGRALIAAGFAAPLAEDPAERNDQLAPGPEATGKKR